MAAEDAIPSILIQTVKESAFYTKNRLEELLSADYPYPTSQEFIRALIAIHKGLLQKLEQMDITTKIENGFEEKAIAIQRYGQILNSLHSLLQILEMGRREYVPQGIVILIANIMKVFSSTAKFLLLPTYEYNYMYVELINPLKTALRDILVDLEKTLGFADKFAIFWFPLAHKENALLNVLLAHEIGHFLSDEKQIVGKLISKVTIDQSKIQEIAQELLQTRLVTEKKDIKINDFFGLETAKAQVMLEVVAKVSEKLRELVADSIAFHLFGPAFLIALGNFLVTLQDPNVEPKGYPSPKVRLRFLIDEFEKAGYGETLKRKESSAENTQKVAAGKFSDIVENWRKYMTKEKTPADDKKAMLVQAAINSVEESIREEVSAVTATCEYSAKKFETEAFTLIDTIDSFVPPAEIGLEEPANPISILNAGMLYEQTLIDNMHVSLADHTMDERLLTRHKLHKLIMKAIESSQTQTTMKEMENKPPES